MNKQTQNNHTTLENLWYWLKHLYRISPGYVRIYLAGIILTLGISLLSVYMPSVLVADITGKKPLETIFRNLALLGGGLLLLYLLQNWLDNTKIVLREKIRHQERSRLIQLCLDADYIKTERADFSEQYDKLMEHHTWYKEYTSQFMDAFSSSAGAIIGMILYVGMLSGLSVWILLLVIAGNAINYAVKIRCNKWDAKNRHKWISLDHKTSYLSRNTSKYEVSKDVHLYHMPPWLRKKFVTELKQRLYYTIRQQANYFTETFSGAFTRLVWEGAAYLYLIYLVCEGRMDAAGFVLFFGIITGFANWRDSIVSGIRQLHRAASFVEDERRFTARLAGDKQEERESLAPERNQIPEITFDNVSFRYEGAEHFTLKNLSLTLRPGEKLALVGLNGAGKTTFIKLLCGFYEPTEGRILVNGEDRSRYTTQSWLKLFSGVFQDAGLFPLSLEENLTLGKKADQARLEECLRMAGLEEKIAKLPHGLQTMFGMESYQDAASFSGGEIQKLMLARALYQEAPFLVLDEPTAALDPLIESQLYERYCRFSENKTSVFISHRLASTRFCDRILLLEDGEAVETGTHEELLAQNGKYAWMFQLQSKYYQKKQEELEAGLL